MLGCLRRARPRRRRVRRPGDAGPFPRAADDHVAGGRVGRDAGRVRRPPLSDVITNVDQTVDGEQSRSPTVFGDIGAADFALVMKDQGSPAAPGPLNAVTITRYRVVYRRTDGRNTPGRGRAVSRSIRRVTVTVGGEARRPASNSCAFRPSRKRR